MFLAFFLFLAGIQSEDRTLSAFRAAIAARNVGDTVLELTENARVSLCVLEEDPGLRCFRYTVNWNSDRTVQEFEHVAPVEYDLDLTELQAILEAEREWLAGE